MAADSGHPLARPGDGLAGPALAGRLYLRPVRHLALRLEPAQGTLVSRGVARLCPITSAPTGFASAQPILHAPHGGPDMKATLNQHVIADSNETVAVHGYDYFPRAS